MPHPLDANLVRDMARSLLLGSDLSSQPATTAEAEYRETILIRGGLYCGRRFEWGPLKAIWLVNENVLRTYDEHDELISQHDLSQQVAENTPDSQGDPPGDHHRAA